MQTRGTGDKIRQKKRGDYNFSRGRLLKEKVERRRGVKKECGQADRERRKGSSSGTLALQVRKEKKRRGKEGRNANPMLRMNTGLSEKRAENCCRLSRIKTEIQGGEWVCLNVRPEKKGTEGGEGETR